MKSWDDRSAIEARRRMPPRRKRREASIENSCVRTAKDQGWEARKMNGLGFAAWPDRLFLPPRANLAASRFWVEFKRPGEELTPRQREMRQDLTERGEEVYACDSREQFLEVLESHSRLSQRRRKAR